MNGKNKISVSQFFITLFLCSMLITCGFFGTGAEKNSILINVLFAIAGVIILILSCVPVYMLNIKTGKTLLQITEEKSKGLTLAIKLFYILCFLIFTCVFLSEFALFMQNQINNEAVPAVVIFIFLAIAAFGCYKGIQPLFRTAVIIFAFVVFSLAFIFFGLLSQTDISNLTASPQPLNRQIQSGLETLLLSLIPLSAYVIFADSLKGNQKYGIFIFSVSAFLLFLITGIFIILVLGDYSAVLSYPAFIISKLSKISVLKGGDGLLFASVTAVTFLISYLFFCCGSKTAGSYHSKTFSIAFAMLSFILSLVMCYFPAVNGFLSSPLLLSLLAAIAVIIIPLLVLALVKRGAKQ